MTVDFATSNGSATAGTDYTAASGFLTFLAGETTKSITVNGLQDSTFEGTESFLVNLSNAFGASLADSQGTGTITDDDPEPLPTITISNESVSEGKYYTKGKNKNTPQLTTMTFTVALSSTSTQTVTVNYATADGSATIANNDYQAASGVVTFNPGETAKAVSVTIVGDNNTEPDEEFTVNLSNASGASIGNASGAGTILNDDSGGGGRGGGNGGGGGKGGGPRRGAMIGDTAQSPVTSDLQADSPVAQARIQTREDQIVAQEVLDDLIVIGQSSNTDSESGTSDDVANSNVSSESDNAFAESHDLLSALAAV